MLKSQNTEQYQNTLKKIKENVNKEYEHIRNLRNQEEEE